MRLEWLEENIRSKGPLGAAYPEFAFIMEGDTPSFLWLIGNGLAGHVTPSPESAETPTRRTRATIWRWREAFQHDFAARMDWTIKSCRTANHNPRGDAHVDLSAVWPTQVPCTAQPGVAHVILAVSDKGSPSLTSYRRVILNVRRSGGRLTAQVGGAALDNRARRVYTCRWRCIQY